LLSFSKTQHVDTFMNANTFNEIRRSFLQVGDAKSDAAIRTFNGPFDYASGRSPISRVQRDP
jgi:GTPase